MYQCCILSRTENAEKTPWGLEAQHFPSVSSLLSLSHICFHFFLCFLKSIFNICVLWRNLCLSPGYLPTWSNGLAACCRVSAVGALRTAGLDTALGKMGHFVLGITMARRGEQRVSRLSLWLAVTAQSGDEPADQGESWGEQAAMCRANGNPWGQRSKQESAVQRATNLIESR